MLLKVRSVPFEGGKLRHSTSNQLLINIRKAVNSKSPDNGKHTAAESKKCTVLMIIHIWGSLFLVRTTQYFIFIIALQHFFLSIKKSTHYAYLVTYTFKFQFDYIIFASSLAKIFLLAFACLTFSSSSSCCTR